MITFGHGTVIVAVLLQYFQQLNANSSSRVHDAGAGGMKLIYQKSCRLRLETRFSESSEVESIPRICGTGKNLNNKLDAAFEGSTALGRSARLNANCGFLVTTSNTSRATSTLIWSSAAVKNLQRGATFDSLGDASAGLSKSSGGPIVFSIH